MDPTRRQFLYHIAEHPDDAAVRLIYADWCEDNGLPERAAFVRWHLANAEYSPEGHNLYARQARQLQDEIAIPGCVLGAAKGDWLAPVIYPAATTYWLWIRGGFVEGITATLDDLVGRCRAVATTQPIKSPAPFEWAILDRPNDAAGVNCEILRSSLPIQLQSFVCGKNLPRLGFGSRADARAHLNGRLLDWLRVMGLEEREYEMLSVRPASAGTP